MNLHIKWFRVQILYKYLINQNVLIDLQLVTNITLFNNISFRTRRNHFQNNHRKKRWFWGFTGGENGGKWRKKFEKIQRKKRNYFLKMLNHIQKNKRVAKRSRETIKIRIPKKLDQSPFTCTPIIFLLLAIWRISPTMIGSNKPYKVVTYIKAFMGLRPAMFITSPPNNEIAINE